MVWWLQRQNVRNGDGLKNPVADRVIRKLNGHRKALRNP